VKVDKDKFDALLGRLVSAPPQEGKTIKGRPGNVKPIFPDPTPQPQKSVPRKA
jgi:hypothetical protein